MLRTLSGLLAGATICAAGLMSSAAQEPKKSERAPIPGGIEGHVKSVDREHQTLTILGSNGGERTFTVTDDTTILGPRGGRVRSRLGDRRFHAGMEITVVATGSTARELHLGYDRGGGGQSTGKAKPAGKRAPTAVGPIEEPAPGGKGAGRVGRDAAKVGAGAAAKTAAKEEEDEDDEIPGTIRSYDSTRRILVVSLLNGRNRSFLLSRDVPVLHRGTPSKQGLADPALKPGASVTVLVDPGGRRVRELHLNPVPAATTKTKSRKAA
jgi:hypothetical protein